METISLTRLYEILAQKVGRNEAECLTQYVEIKVKHEVENKANILASKKDVFSVKEDIYQVKEDIHIVRNEMKDSTITTQRWFLSTFITMVIMILGLYAAILLK
jgi:hypothetical protein